MSDLRTGLVEAMARAYEQHGWNPTPITDKDWEVIRTAHAEAYAEMLAESAAALDAALGFLTDNAEGWHDEAEGWHDEHGQLPDIFDLIAALSDSRDTGEKP